MYRFFEGNFSEPPSSELNELQPLAPLLRCLGDSVRVAGKDDTIFYANTAASALYGYAAGELLGKSYSIFGLEGACPIDFKAVMKAPGQMWVGEVIRARKDGTGFTALLTITPFRNFEGEIVGRVGIARGLTRQKEAENSHKKLSRQQSVLRKSVG